MGSVFAVMQPSNLEFVITSLKLAPGRANWNLVGEGAGVPGATIEKIVRGYVANPKFDTVEKLAKYIRENPQRFSKSKKAQNAA
jgi:predicted transcriptional regulator